MNTANTRSNTCCFGHIPRRTTHIPRRTDIGHLSMFLEETVESGYLAKMTQKGSIPRRNGPKPLYLAYIPRDMGQIPAISACFGHILEETVESGYLAKMTQNSYFLEESVKTAVLAKMTQNGSNSGNMAKTGPKPLYLAYIPGKQAKYMLF